MDLHLIENIVAIADEKSITKAAERRFITQSALNQQLQKLEDELGAPLFIRTRGNWQLTPAGDAYIEAARKMILLRKNVYSRISDYSESRSETLSIALIPERGIDMFSSVYPAFHRAFPNVCLEPMECSVVDMQKQISSGAVDMGLATLQLSQMDSNDYTVLAEEEILLAVPVAHRLAKKGSKNASDSTDISLAEFSEDAFVSIYQRSTMFDLSEQLFKDAGFKPHTLFSTASNITKHRIVNTGIACALLPSTYAFKSENIRYFRLSGHPVWQITMCVRKGSYLSSAARYLIELCTGYWKERVDRYDPNK